MIYAGEVGGMESYMMDYSILPSQSYTPIIYQPILIGAGMSTMGTAWSAYPHIHPECLEIIYVVKGVGEVSISGRRYPVKGGELILYNTNQEHFEDFSSTTEPAVFFHCEFSSLLICGLPLGHICPEGAPPVMPAGRLSDSINRCFEVIFHESCKQKWGYNQIIYARLETLILLVLHLYADYLPAGMVSEAKDTNLASNVKCFIDNNYYRNISLGDLAAAVSASPYYVSHVFSANYGLSPIQYLISRKLGEAKRMLISSSLPIKEIAARLGYKSPSVFTAQFNRHTGISPSQYRMEWKNGKTYNPNNWTEIINPLRLDA